MVKDDVELGEKMLSFYRELLDQIKKENQVLKRENKKLIKENEYLRGSLGFTLFD